MKNMVPDTINPIHTYLGDAAMRGRAARWFENNVVGSSDFSGEDRAAFAGLVADLRRVAEVA